MKLAFLWKICIKSEKSKFSKKPSWVSFKSPKDYLVQISTNLNKNCDLRYNLSEIREFCIFGHFLENVVKKIIGLRDLKWSKYCESGWFVNFCKFLGLKCMYFWFYSSEYTILGAKFSQNLLRESSHIFWKKLNFEIHRKYWHPCNEYFNLSLTWKNYRWAPYCLNAKIWKIKNVEFTEKILNFFVLQGEVAVIGNFINLATLSLLFNIQCWCNSTSRM